LYTSFLLRRLPHDQPVHGQYGSIQRTNRRTHSLKDDDEILDVIEDADIPRERILAVDREKVDEALDVTGLFESAVYESRRANTSAKPTSTRSARKRASRD